MQYTQVRNQPKKACVKNLKDLLYQSKQLFGIIKQLQLTEPSPRPSTNLQGQKIHMSGLVTSHRQFTITPKDKFQDNAPPINANKKFNNKWR